MRRRIGACALCIVIMHCAAAAPLVCPARAPSDWGMVAPGKLESVRVLAYLAGDKLDDEALPSGPPDREWRRAGVLYQSWAMNAGAPQTVYQVDCLYTGTNRYLRLDAARVKQCVAKWNLRGTALVEGSLVFRCE